MLTFKDDVVGVGLKFPENHDKGERTIDFATAYLPPNRLHPTVTLLKDRPDLARVVVAVIDTYVLRQQDTKSTATTAVTLGRTVIRALEYFWLHEIYHLKWVTTGHWEALLDKFVKGGWYLALDLERRASAIDLRTLSLSRRRKKQGVIEYSCDSLLAAMGANMGPGQVRIEYRRGDVHGQLHRTRADELPGVSSISALITQLNNLVELPKDMRALCVAHPRPYSFAESAAAAAQNRTENFDPAQLAALMCEAYRWVSIYSDPIVKLVGHVYSDLTPYEQEEVDESRMLRLLEAPEARELEQLLGFRVATVARLGDWQRGLGLLGLVRTLLAACFVLLGVFNGRRKDEVASKATGLYADAFECIDEELSLFQSYFYCEKTISDYRQFYINEISFKALKTAKAISDIAWSEAGRNGGQQQKDRMRKVFCMPPRGREDVPTWYDYSSDPGIGLLCERATGFGSNIAPNSHMFRRAYAVVFHYRYENADLYALSQQLAHFDLAMTLHYVLDGPSRVLAHHAAKLWGDGGESKKARAAQAAELAAEVKEYARVKLHDDVLEILQGGISVAGGFARLVQRFARKMLGRISYDDADLKVAAKKVSSVLIDRGHTVIPFRHGNCNAGGPKPGARCFRHGQLSRELASPTVCGSCPYHQMKKTHRVAVEDDLSRQRERLSQRPESLQTSAEQKALQATEQLVAFYRKKAQPEAAVMGGE
ncbi:hypothetical protein [Roseateles sp. P5_E4]